MNKIISWIVFVGLIGFLIYGVTIKDYFIVLMTNICLGLILWTELIPKKTAEEPK